MKASRAAEKAERAAARKAAIDQAEEAQEAVEELVSSVEGGRECVGASGGVPARSSWRLGPQAACRQADGRFLRRLGRRLGCCRRVFAMSRPREKRAAAYELDQPRARRAGDGRLCGLGGSGEAMAGAKQRQKMSSASCRSTSTRRRTVGARTLLLREPTLRDSLRKIEQQVTEGIIAVRPSVNLAADVGMRDNLLRLLACYNPLWLRALPSRRLLVRPWTGWERARSAASSTAASSSRLLPFQGRGGHSL